MTDWNPYYIEEEERELNARQLAESMDRHAETMAVLARSRRAQNLHVTPPMEEAIAATSPAAVVVTPLNPAVLPREADPS